MGVWGEMWELIGNLAIGGLEEEDDQVRERVIIQVLAESVAGSRLYSTYK